MIIAGVDGCKKGWMMVKYSEEKYTYGIFSSLDELFDEHTDIDRLLIDMPIGLSSVSIKRTIDQTLRKELKGRSSTVFTPPCREALAFLPDYKQTKLKNIEVEDKSLSIQAFNISDKVKAVDDFLQSKSTKTELIESHPELCFKYLNNKTVVLSKKSKEEGQKERLVILSKFDAAISDLYIDILKNTKRKDAKADDVMDAICLCLVNKLGTSDGLDYLESEERLDEQNVPFKIAYFDAYK